MNISHDVVRFFEQQGFVMVSTLDAKGAIHCSAKGLVSIDEEGWALVADLYKCNTHKNLSQNSVISVTAINEQKFVGYSLQGKAVIVSREEIDEEMVTQWEDKITQRISQRVIHGVQAGSKSESHFESYLPLHPKYLIRINVEDIIDLAPPAKRMKDNLSKEKVKEEEEDVGC